MGMALEGLIDRSTRKEMQREGSMWKLKKERKENETEGNEKECNREERGARRLRRKGTIKCGRKKKRRKERR